ncbi:MAG TPA: SusC/RagA family TonB-linked outer membrane protein [Gemmatimonadaceae bacterium]|jgi:TonB-linked SusC/RagA family outer membrane protein
MSRARIVAVALCAIALTGAGGAVAQAQNAVISGRVTTDFGQPIEGANVFITEMSVSVRSDASGNYTINLPAARVDGRQANLRARAFGRAPTVRLINITPGAQTVNFSLKEDVNRLAEVVVTGVTAGTEQKNLPFQVAHVDQSEMPVPGATNVLSQLAGKVPGLEIVQASGRPGSAPAVMLRGPKSINGTGRGQDPLYIVDGIILNPGIGVNQLGTALSLQGGTLADINPADIESVEVVEGAAAASLYGSRAANGVISITTKSGRNAGSGIHYNVRTEYGGSDIEHTFPYSDYSMMMMDETQKRFCVITSAGPCAQTVDFGEEALRVNQLGGVVALSPVGFRQDFGISSAAKAPLLRNLYEVNAFPVTYNPLAQMVTSGQFTNTTLDASGNNGGTSYFVSGSNLWQQGSIRSLTGFKRNSVRVNVDQNVGNDWTFGARTYYSRAWQDGSNAENGNGFFTLTRSPAAVNLLATDDQGRLYVRSNPLNQGSQNYNPLYYFENRRQNDLDDRFLGNLTARYTPTSWLDLDANGSYDRTNSSGLFMYDKGFRTTAISSDNLGSQSHYAGYGQSYNTAINGSAHRSWGNLTARYTARYLYEQQDIYSEALNGSTLAVAGLTTAKDATTGFGLNSTTQSIRSVGITNGITADWKSRYFIDALVRRDGSSLFGSDNRWANYGRASAAWRISDESWWFLSSVNDLKFRASYGTAGGRPPFVAQYETYTIGTGGSLSPNTQGNAHLRPETTYETELGADMEILHRYGLNLTLAHDITKDQILPVPLPASQGFNQVWTNAGTLDNKTIELSLNVPILQRRNLGWSARFNYDRTITMVTQLNEAPFLYGTDYQNSGSVFYLQAGYPYAEFYGRQFVTSCGQLPSAFQSQCGGAGSAFQKNSDGMIVWVGQGNSLGDGITKNLWNAVLPNGQAPWSKQLNWGMPIKVRDPATGSSANVYLGSALPKFRISHSQTFNYKKLFLYALVDGSFGQYVWNEARAWSFGDYQDREEDQHGKSVADAKPLGYYWRQGPADAGIGTGGLYDALGVNSVNLEKASYAKIREVNISYNYGAVRGVGDWTIGLIGRNLKTFTNYSGYDPEVGVTNAGSTSGSGAVNGIDAYQFPNLRTFSLSLSTRF